MNKKHAQSALVPRLRFREFQTTPAWRKRAIGELLAETTRAVQMSDDEEYSLVTVKRRYGGVVFRERLKGGMIKVKSQFLVQRDDFLISKRQIVHNACGVVPVELGGSIVSNEYSVLRAKPGCDIRFIEYFAQQPCVSRSFLKSSVGIVIEKMLFKLDWWLAREFLFPQREEQSKIAACLGSLDDLIVAEGRKLEALREHKKGLMQQLFPRPERIEDGVKIPAKAQPGLRFPEFQDSPEWAESTIGSRCESFTGGTPDTTRKECYGGPIPFIRSAEIGSETTAQFLTEEGFDSSAAKKVGRGDVLVALYGANSGDVALARVDGAINQAILCLRPEGSKAFLYHYLAQKKAWILATYLQGGQGNLSGDIVKSVPLHFPSPEEQDTVADCLSSLDAIIAAQAETLDALRTHKRGLMQQLFPLPDGSAS